MVLKKRRKAYVMPGSFNLAKVKNRLFPPTAKETTDKMKRWGLEPAPARKKSRRKKPVLLNDDNYETKAPRITTINRRRDFRTPTATYRPIDPFITPGIVQNERDIPQRVEEGKRIEQSGSVGIVGRAIHRTRIDTGHPTTKTLRGIAKENGTTTTLLYDTKMVSNDANLEVTQNLISRGELDSANGFNHKTFRFLHGAASPGYRALFEAMFSSNSTTALTNWLNLQTSQKFTDKRYMSFMWLESMISIFNENAYLPVKVKIHCIKPKNKLDSQSTFATVDQKEQNYLKYIKEFVFTDIAPTSLGNLQAPFGIPANYIYSTPTYLGKQEEAGSPNTTDNYRRFGMEVYVDNKCYLNQSAWFRQNFTIDKTISKTLQPNDTWVFTHRQHFGPGIDVDAARSSFLDMQITRSQLDSNVTRVGNDVPLGYIYMVEHVGVPCTAVVGDKSFVVAEPVVRSTYQGTSDGQLHFEYKSRIKFINSSQNNATQLGADGSDQNVHMRMFTKQDYPYTAAFQQPRYVLPQNIVEEYSEVGFDKAYIPVVTDRSIKGSDQRGSESFSTNTGGL